MRYMAIGCALLLALACGKDNGGNNGGEVIDASGGGGSDGGQRDASAVDSGSGSGGTQGVGQFCDTLPEGGPFCVDGLECCADKVCQVAGECGGSTGFIPCECTDDCTLGGSLCCESTDQTFCTKRNGCDAVGGTEITVCP